MSSPSIMPQPGRLPHILLQVLRACARPLTRAELRAQLAAREVEATPLAIERATCKFTRHGLLAAQRPGRSDRAAEFSLTHRGRQVLTDLDIELWWRTEGQVAV